MRKNPKLYERLPEWNENPEIIRVGMGATFTHGNDRIPCTVVEIKRNGREVVLRADRAVRTDANGMSDRQSYEYYPDPTGEIYRVSRREFIKGEPSRFKLIGHATSAPGCYADFGGRSRFHDYSF